MAKPDRQTKTVYRYDRLWAHKLGQAYQLLVPSAKLEQPADSLDSPSNVNGDENSGHLCESLLQSTKGQ